MAASAPALRAFLVAQPAVIRVVLSRVRGSSPRDAGTEMFVAPAALWGTIGGGQLEYLAIDAARAMLREGVLTRALDVPLGPEIGQCCGGRVDIGLTRMRASDRRTAEARAARHDATLPHVHVMGAGHVGRAVADLLQHLPVRCILIDTRPEEIALCTAAVERRVSVLPEAEIANAPPGSAFIVLTHDHGLDFLLTAAALDRGDAAYVGMIGSASKRAKFRAWAKRHASAQNIDDLTCPIGASGSRDKRPGVIAAFVVAEVMAELTSETAATAPIGAQDAPLSGHGNDREGKSA
ncbi:xanthine dehydrogenase accessory protein XdhC [Roseovarius autotrophicus]|uniref:xanthine dehydrogenase accessory protein XdhC n=1 Tax=Roseovarius autotrophicus TaxID=2824121 RepID=UPI0019EF9C8D|nr:xanthine dehydrogenase accessory protein XdhC [Roseovarius autotrophicus]MBE0453209.1 xanthine dehydrogenase accessory protein XdhC [Roseovarius sp.]